MKLMSTPALALFIGLALALLYAGWRVESGRRGDKGAPAPAVPAAPAPARDGASPEPRFRVDPATAAGCAGDDDCVRVDADCCGLAGGGRCTAVPRRKLLKLAQARVAACRDVICPSQISDHPTCHGRVACLDGRCAVIAAPDAAPFGLGIKPIE
ncbi:MAG: hypothetical protein JXR83_20470 [Deltaproteobacteria bacterium]|nr:hypothetical protein [Deltaproteobacteria bacterium]